MEDNNNPDEASKEDKVGARWFGIAFIAFVFLIFAEQMMFGQYGAVLLGVFVIVGLALFGVMFEWQRRRRNK
ncbi:MAG: hypothetical protein IPL62_21020 [Caulobacteraceae bacterium]|nr:hypothetical protein [Caulobacteraceae bacterium]